MAETFSIKVIEIAVIHRVGSKTMVNVWHMFHDQELTGPDKAGVVRDFANNWQDHMMLNMAQDVKLVEFRWRSMDPNDASVGTVAPDAAKRTEGGTAGPMQSPATALLVEKRTANRPRGARDGRCYLPGVNETWGGPNGNLEASVIAAVQPRLDSFYNGISDTGTVVGGWNGDSYPVVLETTPASRLTKRQNGGVTPPPATVNSRRVTSLILDPVLATQRERLR